MHELDLRIEVAKAHSRAQFPSVETLTFVFERGDDVSARIAQHSSSNSIVSFWVGRGPNTSMHGAINAEQAWLCYSSPLCIAETFNPTQPAPEPDRSKRRFLIHSELQEVEFEFLIPHKIALDVVFEFCQTGEPSKKVLWKFDYLGND